ncbi:TerD domain containing protein [Novymonas esmeraldas]|uniref:TerD domain containing protein n=1 Tax=Novymonas esmeraldas TaxID=1808958 RepID=A0AAW0F5J5_9TRYP
MSCSDVRQKVFRVPGSVVLSVGLSWDFVGTDPVDLDLSAVCFTKEGRFLDVVFFNHLFPEGTDEAALRQHYMVDPALLPYMFLSGDSTVGGEEENQLPGLALAARRRHQQLRRRTGPHEAVRGGMLGTRDYTAAAANVFNRIYEEEQLADVQRAVDDAIGYDVDNSHDGDVAGGAGPARHRRRRHRELADEVLTFVMSEIPHEADAIFLTVSSYTGQDFTLLSRAKLVVYNESMNERVGVVDLKQTTENGTANLAAMLIRVPAAAAADGGHGGRLHGSAGATQEWDLRELNVRTFGYTFVDTLPLIMDVLGVARPSRLDVLQNLPDYSLSKVKSEIASWTLSDVRFGVGWSGEHDVDAFLLLLDENNNYVDHLYPKQGKLRSMARDVARHSGDALSGTSAAGDEEFIDLLTYRVPDNVGSIVFGATWMESFGPARHTCRSIFDVPQLYLRLQNRTVMNPYSMEVDRWPVHREAHDPKIKKHLPTSYTDAEEVEQPVRTVVLGALMKTGTQPVDALFPNGRRIDQHFQKHRRATSIDGHVQSRGTSVTSRAGGGGGASEHDGDDDEERVPLFQLVPIHQYVPVDPRGGFSRVIPYLQCMMAYATTIERDTIAAARRRIAAAEATRTGTAMGYSAVESSGVAPLDTSAGTADTRVVLNREHNMVGWSPATGASVRRGGQGETAVEAARERAAGDKAAATALRDRYGRMWSEMKHYDNRTDLFAIAVQFLAVVEVQPQMPDEFRCHGEAWVFGQTSCIVPVNGSVSIFDNKPYRSPDLVDRERLNWVDAPHASDNNNNGGGGGSGSQGSCGVFIVRKYDRLRVMLFETASVGVADLDLLSMDALWNRGEDHHRHRSGSLADRFNPVECTVRLDAGSADARYSGEVRLRVSRVPLPAAMAKLQRQADKANTRREQVQRSRTQQDERYHNKHYQPCSLM